VEIGGKCINFTEIGGEFINCVIRGEMQHASLAWMDALVFNTYIVSFRDVLLNVVVPASVTAAEPSDHLMVCL